MTVAGSFEDLPFEIQHLVNIAVDRSYTKNELVRDQYKCFKIRARPALKRGRIEWAVSQAQGLDLPIIYAGEFMIGDAP